MSLNLEIKATHKPKSDVLELQVYVHDPDDQRFHPEKINSGKATLYRMLASGRQALGTATFDRREGTASGCVRVMFLHPRFLQGVAFEVTVVIDGSVTLTKEGTFTILPLETQGQSGGEPVDIPEQPAILSPRLTAKGT